MAAIPFTEGGINYLLDDATHTVTVTGRENATITNIIIKETLEYNSDIYTVTSIKSEAFANSNIVSLTMPDTIKAIGYSAFSKCSNLSGNLVLPPDLNSLGSGAFADCISLTGELVIPKCVTETSQYVFQNCSGFTGIRIEEGVTVIPAQIAMNCTGLTGDLVIPDSVLFIRGNAFGNCSGLDGALTIGKNVETIQEYAFYDCSFTEKITIPDSVTFLYSYAFSDAPVERDSFIKLADVDFDLDDLLKLPDTASLQRQLEKQYEDTVYSTTDNSFIYKSANADEIEINYAQAKDEGYDFLFIMDISSSMQEIVKTTVDSVEYSYPRMVYTAQILDELSAKLLNTDYDNRIAITTFSSYNTSGQWDTNGFIEEYSELQSLFWSNYIWDGNQTDYSIGLNSAVNLINNRIDTSRKVIVFFFSDGRPNEGSKDSNGVYGGNEAQTLRNINAPLYPISIFLNDAELAEGRAAMAAISYDKKTYYEARDVETFQTILTEIIGDAIAEIEATVILDELSQYFELATGTTADLNAGCGSADIDGDGKIVWNLNGCGIGQIQTLNIKIKVVDDEITQSDDYPTNASLELQDPYGTELLESPEVYIGKGLTTSKVVSDTDGDGKASPGEELTYAIRATNNGEVALNNLLIKDTLTGVLPYVKDTGAVPVAVDNGGAASIKTIQDLNNGFTVNLGAGKTVTVVFKVTVTDTLDTQAVTKITNQATVGDTTPAAEIPTKADSEYAVVKMVKNASGKDVDKGTIRAGDILNYSVRATALSLEEPIGPITIIDEISEYVEHTGGEETITTMSGETFKIKSTFSTNIMTVPTGRYLTSVGDWIEVDFGVKAKDDSGGNTVYNQSIITAGDLSAETNMTEVEVFQLEDHPVKEVSESSEAGRNGSQVRPGDEIAYNIIYMNYTTETAVVTITDRLAYGVDFISATNGGAYDESTRTVTWTITNVPGDTSGTVSVVVRVNRNAVRRIGNYAIVRVGDNEPQFSNHVLNLIQGSNCHRLKQVTKCRKEIKGRKIWEDIIGNTRPPAVEIVLLRDGEVYKSIVIDSMGDGSYVFGCLPVWKNSGHKYVYRVVEV